MKIPKIFRRIPPEGSLPTVVVFAGGMGTQIIQAAVYFSLKAAGRQVYADFSYFEREARMAEVGKAGQLTHWFWQLEHFGLTPASFEQTPGFGKRDADFLHDGPRMMELGLKALEQQEIRERFQDRTDARAVLSEEVLARFLCIHVRRGDYVNVASHLIPDEEFIRLVRHLSGLIDHLVILSDSPIEPSFREAVAPHFRSASFLDNIDPYTSHGIMRRARILVCSNSTFSLTAAMMNPTGFIVIPKRWFGEKDRAVEAPIQARCLFQIMG